MKLFRLASLLPFLTLAAGVQGQGTNQLLNRSHVGVVYETVDGSGHDAVGVRLKFDFVDSPAEHAYLIEVDPNNVVPVAGRWEPDTTESVGFLERTSRGRFYLRTAQTTGGATSDFDFFPTAQSGQLFPLMGDWDGNGLDSAGIYNRTTGFVHLKNENTTAAPIDSHQLPIVGGGSRPAAGDWNGDGLDGIAILLPNLDPKVVRFFEDPYGTAFTDFHLPEVPGSAGSLWPVAGDWNFDGRDYVGVYGEANQTFYLLFAEESEDWDVVLPLASEPGARPVAGSWDGGAFRYAVPRTAGGLRPRAFPQMIAAGDDHALYFTAPTEQLGSPPSDSFYYNLYTDSATELLFDNRQWSLDPSEEIIAHPMAAIALGTVFSSPTADFKHPDGTFYENMAVYVVEHSALDPFAGWVCLSYFPDATGGWTPPIFANRVLGAAANPCDAAHLGDGRSSGIIPAELVSGFREGTDLFFGVMEGDGEKIDAALETERTITYLFKATTAKPWYFEVQDGQAAGGEFTEAGMNTPNTGATAGNPRWVHNFGVNLDFTLDPVESAVYWSRAYPYPFDLDGGIPCRGQGCPTGIGLNPNRVQIYRMPLVPGKPFGEQLETFFAGPWELVADVGAPKGYPSTAGGACGDTELIDEIQDGLPGVDVNSVTFVKDADGLIARDAEGRRAVLLGGAAVKDRMNGECDYADRSIYVWPIDRIVNNLPPVATDDHFLTGWETPIEIELADLLANDTDPDDDPLTVCGLDDPQFGTLDVGPDAVVYTPPPGCLIELDSFHYTACDHLGDDDTAEAHITIGGTLCPGGGDKARDLSSPEAPPIF